MIVLVWSLVSSAVEAARRRRLAAFLQSFYADPSNGSSMLVCRRTRPECPLPLSPSSGRLARFTSEPQMNTHRLLYRTERAELAVENAAELHSSEWRFVDSWAIADAERIFFVAVVGRCPPGEENEHGAVYLDSCCDRVAWHKLQPASLYACPSDRFVDIVYAFSEGALFENNASALVESLHTISVGNQPSSSPVHGTPSMNGSSLSISQQHKPLPLLEQLFWGDEEGGNKVQLRYASETALHGGYYGSLPRRTTSSSPRRRFRSCTSSSRSSKDPLFDFAPSSRFFDSTTQLPPFLRFLERKHSITNGNMDQFTGRSVNSTGVSPSVTLDLTNLGDINDIRSISDLLYADESSVPTSPLAVTDSSSYAALMCQAKKLDSAKENGEPDIEMTKIVDLEAKQEQIPKINGDLDEIETDVRMQTTPSPTKEQEPLRNSKPPAPPNGTAKRMNGVDVEKRIQALPRSCPPPAASSRRRHSVMVEALANTTFAAADISRNRSVSPMLGERGRRSVRASICGDVSSFELPRSYTPSRRFFQSRRTSVMDRALCKPPSILVYTGDHKDLYGRIRGSLSRVLPFDCYTVFNISADALRKQPWVEKATTCLIVAETEGLDDKVWSKIQAYFNQSGKIIFVCQNRLLAGLTNCESSKKQADILRMALGSSNSVVVSKEFESFLKKSLKMVSKNGHVNETLRSKDLTGGVGYSVVLTKTKETPLMLYMESSAHQAAAMFSDATPDQLLAPGSHILRDALQRVGVTVQEHEVPETTGGVMVAQEKTAIDEIKGIRYGEEIGKEPQLFLRTFETAAQMGMPSPSRSFLPIQVGHSNLSEYAPFNFPLFFSRLSTNRLGRFCLHVPVTTSTMDVMASLSDAVPSMDGAVVVAGQQVSGVGRGGNEFISPVGAAMFTVSMQLPKKCSIANNPSFIQHIFAVAVVDAVNSLSNMKDFPLRIKWPNDFYYNRSHKIGGMLATAKFRDNSMSVTLGAGLNVTNSQPTVCLNDIVPESEDLKFTVEEVIAESLNKFERWLNIYEMKGRNALLDKYYEYWLHDREEVLLEESGEKVVIRGLDEYGYLQVRSKRTPGKLISVGDNGNTFDMMKGLIRHKM